MGILWTMEYLFFWNGLREIIRRLKAVYEDTGSEDLRQIIAMTEELQYSQGDKEEHWRSEELLEAFANIDNLPHSVRTWLLTMREDELKP